MSILSSSLRSAGTFFLACLVSLALFGLILAVFSALPWPAIFSLRLWTVIFSAGAGFLAGGVLAGRLNRQSWQWHSLAFGLLFGGFSFAYLFGINLTALLAVLLATLLAWAGGWLAANMRPPA